MFVRKVFFSNFLEFFDKDSLQYFLHIFIPCPVSKTIFQMRLEYIYIAISKYKYIQCKILNYNITIIYTYNYNMYNNFRIE